MGIRLKFVSVIGCLVALAMLVLGVASYKFSMNNAMDEAKHKGQLIANYIVSSRKYFHDVQRPLINEILEEDRFYPELMSEFVIVKETWDLLKDDLPGYEFKQATLNPLLPSNKANESETTIIKNFQENQDLTRLEGILKREGEKYFFLAKPIKVDSTQCLRCHGDPKKAPKDQVEIYGTESGYHWKMGDILSADVIYIPMKQALASVTWSAMVIFLTGIGILTLALLGIWFFLNSAIVSPILALSKRTEEISLGDNLETPIELTANKDEIGSLAQSIDRLRISMDKMLKRQSR